MKKYIISAMVVYCDQIEENSKEEAINRFIYNCPYDIDGDTIECEEESEE